MKHKALRLIAFFLGIMAVITVAIGLTVTVVISIGAASTIARVGFVLGGFIVTIISAMMVLVASRLIYLFIKMEEDLAELVAAGKH
jgi:hypothetical protein